MQQDDLEHPDALDEAVAISRAGGVPYDEALGEMCEVFDWLIDARASPDELLDEQTRLGSTRLFTRCFWSPSGGAAAGVAAVIGLKDARLVLLAVVPIGLARSPPLNRAAAIAHALSLAQQRSASI